MGAFDPISALIGGVLIGLASALLMLLNGRIAGISGILGGALTMSAGDKIWRLSFIAGLIAAPIIVGARGHPLPEPQMPTSWLLIVAAGFLVGFGARYGGGCTSGHGVCGIARLSARSIVATGVFMLSAIVVVAVMRHGFGG
ncbi:MAG: YeeE/YedE family protein [Pseudolabrys sp.]